MLAILHDRHEDRRSVCWSMVWPDGHGLLVAGRRADSVRKRMSPRVQSV
jgi:hypothetical protein